MRTAAFDESFDVRHYNDLGSVEDADRQVRQGGQLTRFLGAAAQIICRHEEWRRFGIALLHRHNTCSPGEQMVEAAEQVDTRPALVTRPLMTTPYSPCGVATVWRSLGRRYFPLEFSTDATAVALANRGPVAENFLDEFSELVGNSPVGHLVGLSIIDREFYARSPRDVPLEYSDVPPRCNSIFLTDPSQCTGDEIETAWRVRASSDPRCIPTVVCDSVLVCAKICHKTGPGTHSGQTVHTPQPDHQKNTIHYFGPGRIG